MNTHAIDEAIDKYVHERMESGKKRAEERFLAYVYTKFVGDELHLFLQKVGGLSRYYIDFFRVMQNPFKGPELAWFLSLLTMGIYGSVMMSDESTRDLGIITLTGALINIWTLVKALLKKWCRMGVLIAIYREIIEIAEHEASA